MASELPSLTWRLTVKEGKALCKGQDKPSPASQWLDFKPTLRRWQKWACEMNTSYGKSVQSPFSHVFILAGSCGDLTVFDLSPLNTRGCHYPREKAYFSRCTKRGREWVAVATGRSKLLAN